MADRTIRLLITGSSAGAVQALRLTGDAAERTVSKLDRVERAGRKMSSLGSTMTQLAVPIVALGAYSVKAAASFQSSMTLLRTQAGASTKQVGQLSKAVTGLAPSVGLGPNVLAQGLYHIVSALNKTTAPAQRVSKEMQVLKVASEGAQVGHANLVDVTNALDGALVSGMKGVKNYSQAMGVLNATVGAGDMSMQDLASAFGTGLTGPMKTYGVSIKDVGAALAVFGDNNVRGAEAGTKLGSAIRIMSAPSAAAAKYFNMIGLSTGQLANDIRTGGLGKALTDLKAKLDPYTKTDQGVLLSRMFGGRQSTGVQTLLAQLDRFKATYKELSAGAGGFGGDVKATQQTVGFKWQQFTAQMQVDLIKLGNAIMPLVVKYLPKLTVLVASVVAWFTKLPKPVKQFFLFFTAFLAIGGPILMFTGRLVTAVASIGKAILWLKNPFGLLSSDVEGAAGDAGKLGGTSGVLRGAFTGLLGPLAMLAKAALIAAAVLLAIKAAPKLEQAIAGHHHGAAMKQGAIFGGATGVAASAFAGSETGATLGLEAGPLGMLGGAALGAIAGGGAGLISSLFGHSGGIVPGGLSKGSIPHMASGGLLAGYGGGDRRLAVLEDGEGVLRKESVASMGQRMFNAINASGSVAGGPQSPNEVYVAVPIRLTLGGRIMAEEVVHTSARATALSGRFAVNS